MGSGLETNVGGGEGVRLRNGGGRRSAIAGLPQGGDVVDIHAQTNHPETLQANVGKVEV
jgi:hypothetical protein